LPIIKDMLQGKFPTPEDIKVLRNFYGQDLDIHQYIQRNSNPSFIEAKLRVYGNSVKVVQSFRYRFFDYSPEYREQYFNFVELFAKTNPNQYTPEMMRRYIENIYFFGDEETAMIFFVERELI
jgi:hypothetical protein